MRISSALAALAFTLAAGSTASAQDAGSPPEKGRARPVFGLFGGLAEDAMMDIEVSSISTTGTPGPDTKSDANRNIDYQVRHQLLAFVLGLEAAPKEVKGLEVSVSLVLGSASTVLTESADEGSVYNPNPGDGDFRNNATDNGSFVFGFALRGHLLVQNAGFVGIHYDFVTGTSEFNDEPFFDSRIEGDYEFTRHRIRVFGGGKVGPLMPYISVGFILYDATADLRQADDPTPDTWDADFEAEDPFRLALGVQADDGGRVTGRAELSLLGELGLSVLLVVRA